MSDALRFREFISEVRDTDDKERSFSHAISDESVDAHGSIIKLDGWDLKRFKANPIVLFGHGSREIQNVMGRSKRIWKEDGKLMSRTEFAGEAQNHALAETAYRLVRDGFIRAWSVGFHPKEWEPRTDISDEEKAKLWDPYVYTKSELMEYSLVPIPSNPNALLDAKRAGHNIEPVMSWYTDQVRQIAAFYNSRLLSKPIDTREDEWLYEVENFLLEETVEELRR